MRKMRKIKTAAAAFAVAGGLLASPVAAGTAHAASTQYTFTAEGYCDAINNCDYASVSLLVYSTYSANQVWINGHVGCTHSGQWVITWCSNTNNGKSYLNVGMNWSGPDFPGNTYDYSRINIYANGIGCSGWGTKNDVTMTNFQCEKKL
jgi:hypothetical protein